MKTIKMLKKTGFFAENKDLARDIRLNSLIPSIKSGKEIIIDFEGVNSTTQSFIHALISDLFRKFGSDFLDQVKFKNCSKSVRGIIEIVVDYMQEGLLE